MVGAVVAMVAGGMVTGDASGGMVVAAEGCTVTVTEDSGVVGDL